MKLINLYKKLIKKSFRIDKYFFKSGSLDILCFLFFIFLLIISSSFLQYYLTNVSVLEQNYATLINEESIGEDYTTFILEKYLDDLNFLFKYIIGIIFFLILFLFLFNTFIKLFQYRMLKKSYFRNFKEFIKLYWLILRNTFPLFLIILLSFIILIFVLALPFTILIILILLLGIIYWLFLPILRIYSMQKLYFKKTWLTFFKDFLKILKISIVPIIITIICLIIFTLLTIITNSINIPFLEFILFLIIIFCIIFTLSSLRRYLLYSISLLDYKNEK